MLTECISLVTCSGHGENRTLYLQRADCGNLRERVHVRMDNLEAVKSRAGM